MHSHALVAAVNFLHLKPQALYSISHSNFKEASVRFVATEAYYWRVKSNQVDLAEAELICDIVIPVKRRDNIDEDGSNFSWKVAKGYRELA